MPQGTTFQSNLQLASGLLYGEHPGVITLRSPAGAPYDFSVEISPRRKTSEPAFVAQISGEQLGTGPTKIITYHIREREHKDYLDLFASIACDFGTRLPLNRRPQSTPPSEQQFSSLLTKNLCDRILYGYGDPGVLRVEAEDSGKATAYYYLVATSNDAPDAFPILRSTDLKTWEPRGFVFPRGHTPPWASIGENEADYWAPEIHKIDQQFRVYFTARHKVTHELCIGVASSSHPEGPYVAADEPLLAGDRIDPHVLVNDNSDAYLYWKQDSNSMWPSLLNEFIWEFPASISQMFEADEDRKTASLMACLWNWICLLRPMERFCVQQVLIEAVTSDFNQFHQCLRTMATSECNNKASSQIGAILANLKTGVYVQKLGPDGLHVTGPAKKILENDQPWEAHVVEGVCVAKHGNNFYLFYAGNDFSTPEYGIGVAISESPLGPFYKIRGPFLRSTATWSAPGHPSLVLGPNGSETLLLHAYFPGAAGYKEFRALLSLELDFQSGSPVPRSTKAL